MSGLPDYLDYNLRVLFVGYNPGERAASLGHHYAGRGNRFWRLMYESGLTERLYRPEEDGMLLHRGFGLTNLVPRPSRSSSDLTPGEMLAGAAGLRKKIALYRPEVVCFLGKEVYRKYAGVKSGTPVRYGPVYCGEGDSGVIEFVAPNPSGRSTVPYDEMLQAFHRLRDFVESRKAGDPG